MNPSLFDYIVDETLLLSFVSGLPTFALLLIIAVCIVMLSMGADWMIDGVVDLAERTGMPKIVIGATVVSLGLIFGLTCILAAVPVNRFILNRTGWVQVSAAVLLVLISLGALLFSEGTPKLERWVGFLFLALLVVYLYMTYLWSKQGTDVMEVEGVPQHELMSVGKSWFLIFIGLTLVIVGARILVPSASEIAIRLGVPEDVIAATMVAFGTSLPELMTAIAAVRKGHPEITVGNIVGADVLNVLFVIGAAAAAAPLIIPMNFFYFHFPAMLIILFSFRIFISMNKSGQFYRWQGIWLLSVYAVYVILQYSLNIESAH